MSGNMTTIKRKNILQNFILPALESEKYGNLLRWENKEAGIFTLYWKSMKDVTWNYEYHRVFIDYDKQRNRYSPKSPYYYTKSKGRFRCALNKSGDFKELRNLDKNVKRYQFCKNMSNLKDFFVKDQIKKKTGCTKEIESIDKTRRYQIIERKKNILKSFVQENQQLNYNTIYRLAHLNLKELQTVKVLINLKTYLEK